MSGHMAGAAQPTWALDVPPEAVPIVELRGPWWRQTDPKYDALALPPVARTGGRCHRKNEEPLVYASSSSNAAWGELFRHVYSGVSPFEVIRTMSELEVVGLPVVDFDDPVSRALFDVSERMLTSNSYVRCRQLADALRTRRDRFGGLILPSAAVAGEQTLVVFKEWISGRLRVV
jgi:RES domain